VIPIHGFDRRLKYSLFMNRSWLCALFLCLSLAACGVPETSVDKGQVLHRGNGEEPESLDVHKSTSTEAGHIQRDFGEGLVGYTPEGDLRPAAAAH